MIKKSFVCCIALVLSVHGAATVRRTQRGVKSAWGFFSNVTEGYIRALLQKEHEAEILQKDKLCQEKVARIQRLMISPEEKTSLIQSESLRFSREKKRLEKILKSKFAFFERVCASLAEGRPVTIYYENEDSWDLYLLLLDVLDAHFMYKGIENIVCTQSGSCKACFAKKVAKWRCKACRKKGYNRYKHVVFSSWENVDEVEENGFISYENQWKIAFLTESGQEEIKKYTVCFIDFSLTESLKEKGYIILSRYEKEKEDVAVAGLMDSFGPYTSVDDMGFYGPDFVYRWNLIEVFREGDLKDYPRSLSNGFFVFVVGYPATAMKKCKKHMKRAIRKMPVIKRYTQRRR